MLLSPVITFLLAIAVEMLAWGMVDTGVPRLVLVGGSAAGLVLFRRLRARSRHAAPGEAWNEPAGGVGSWYKLYA